MHLPNYFLADLPKTAPLTPAMLEEACRTLKRNRAQYLAAKSTDSLLRVIDSLAQSWLRPDYPFRELALKECAGALHFSKATMASGLDHLFRRLSGENLQALIAQDLGHGRRLDELVAAVSEQKHGRMAMARGPEFILHFTAGNVPDPTVVSIVLGLLTRSAQFVKCASGTSLLPRLFAHSLYDLEPKLAACVEMAEWPGGTETLETPLLAEADCVTATGSDETIAAIRARVPASARFLAYGHRVSFGYITREALSGFGVERLAARAAADAAAWNQLGCLSPHLFYAETGGRVSPEEFAGLLASEMEKLETAEPRGPVPAEVAAAITSRRHFYQVRASAHPHATRLWHSAHSTAWTVIHEADPRFQFSCLNRFVYVKAAASLKEALESADAVRGKVSTVGLGATDDEAQAHAQELARWGATRVCPIGQMQRPPMTWRHDGRPSLGDLITWSEWEMG